MHNKAKIPIDRIRISASVHGCDAIHYLQTIGLPPRLEWWFPIQSRNAKHSLVEFDSLKDPRRMSEILAETPEWFQAGRTWSEYVAIGTWNKLGGPGEISQSSMVCIDLRNGAILNVNTDPEDLDRSLKDQINLASCANMPIPELVLFGMAASANIIFVNSSPQQMMNCFEQYFIYVNYPAIRAETFLKSIKRIDRDAGESFAMWFLLVADSLEQDDY